MRVQKRLIGLVGIGILLIVTITILSLWNMSATFSLTTQAVSLVTAEFRTIVEIEKQADTMSSEIHQFVRRGERRSLQVYGVSRDVVFRMLDSLSVLELEPNERNLLEAIREDFRRIDEKARRVFELESPRGKNTQLAQMMLTEVELAVALTNRDLDVYKEQGTTLLESIMGRLHENKKRINLLFATILATAIGFLAWFGVYIHRTVSVPLARLWEGTGAISGGNLDYQMQIRGKSEIGKLGERFNEMAQKLKHSYTELEQRLFDRTREIAALNSVALSLGQAGNLVTMLENSLVMVLNSMSGMEPRGGIFLCEQDGKRLSLTVHKGLSPQFVAEESTIAMGECLCGRVAETGEMMFSEQGCPNPDHDRSHDDRDHAHIIIPIKSRGMVHGVMFLYPSKSFSLKPSDVQMLDSIGAQLGMAVENFRFYREVKESSEKYWDLFENARDIFVMIDMEGRFTAVNRAAENFLGSTKLHLHAKSIFDFLTEEGSVVARRLLVTGGVGMKGITEVEVLKGDGNRAYVEVIARRVGRHRAAAGFHLSARDVTEQKHLRQLLIQAERVGAIGQIGAAVRHEINNPLTTVIGNIELLMERFEGKDGDLCTRLGTILNNALRIAEIVKKLEGIKQERTIEYVKGVNMTDLKQE